MGIIPDRKSFQAAIDRLNAVPIVVYDAIVSALEEAGEYVVSRIRDGSMSNWLDDSGNMRSSVGYAVGRRGRIAAISSFSSVMGGTEGAHEGRRLAQRVVSDNSRHEVCLVIVVGMEYAAYVEAVDGKIVLSGGELYLRKMIVPFINDRVKKALKRL